MPSQQYILMYNHILYLTQCSAVQPILVHAFLVDFKKSHAPPPIANVFKF